MGDHYDFDNNVPNAWIASVPGHPLWIRLLEDIQRADKNINPENIAGNGLFAKTIQDLPL